jgi:hypothetical protein
MASIQVLELASIAFKEPSPHPLRLAIQVKVFGFEKRLQVFSALRHTHRWQSLYVRKRPCRRTRHRLENGLRDQLLHAPSADGGSRRLVAVEHLVCHRNRQAISYPLSISGCQVTDVRCHAYSAIKVSHAATVRGASRNRCVNMGRAGKHIYEIIRARGDLPCPISGKKASEANV